MKILILIFVCFVMILLPAMAQNYDSEILSHASHYFASKSKLTRIDTVTLQINNRMGDNAALIVIPYSKSDNLSIGNAWIEDNEGNIVRKLKKNEIKEQSAISDFSLYEDDFVKVFELKHNIYPYKLVYSFKLSTSNFISIVNRCANHRLNTPIRNMKITVNTPLNYPVLYKQSNTPAPIADTIDNNRQLTWHINYTPVKRQKNAPISGLNLPQIDVVPLNFKYGKQASWESWETFGDWIYLLNAKQDDLPDYEKNKISQLVSNADTPRKKAEILYDYLQNYTRYVNVSIDIGGLKSYPASYVAKNKYGDCKALCNYMKSMLKHVGIESYYTLVKSGDEIIEIDENFPAQVFDHVIITIPFENDTVFLECTSKNTAFGYLGTFTQGRKAFIVAPNGKSRFVNTPALTANDVLCTRKIQVAVSDIQKGIDIQMILRGDEYEQYVQLASGLNRNTVEKYLRSYVMPGSYDLLDFNFEKAQRDVAEIGFNFKIKLRDVIKQYGDKMIISPLTHEFALYELPENRTQPLQLDYPIHYADTIEYIFAKEVKDSSIINNTEISSVFGHYKNETVINGNKIIVYKTILIGKGAYPLSDYGDFYNFISAIKTNEKKVIHVVKP